MSSAITLVPENTGPSTKGLVISAYAALFLLIAGLGGLSSVVLISGAIVTSGRLVVESYPKPVQHLKGGIVADLLVSNGEKVSADQLLLRLDETQTKANLGIVEKRLNELNVRSARLLAEEGGATAIDFPDTVRSAAARNPEIAHLMAGEEKLFAARQQSQIRKKDQLEQRIMQYRQQIEGLQAQIEGKHREIALVAQETIGVSELVSKELLSVTRLRELQRQAAQLDGELGGLIASVAETKGRITETELQRMQVDDDVRSQASSDLRDAQAQIAEYNERRIAAEDDLAHIDIRAPQDGIVQDLAVHAPGAVISPGTPIMTIVPVSDDLIAEVKIAPQDIDQIVSGQKVMMRFSAFNQRTTPEIKGHLIQVAADLTVDQRTGASFYLARIAPDDGELPNLGDVKLIPGMPVEAFVQTGDRTILSYLLKPAADQIGRAFKED